MKNKFQFARACVGLYLCAIMLQWLTGCVSVKGLPSVQYQGLRIEQAQLDPQTQQANLDLKLIFRFVNPYQQRIFFPNPTITMELGEFSQTLVPQDTQTIFWVNGLDGPGPNYADRAYDLKFNFDPNGEFANVLGKDAPYRFAGEFNLDLPLGIGNHSLEFEQTGTVRLPLPPKALLPTAQQSAQLTLKSYEEVPGWDTVKNYVNAAESFINTAVSVAAAAIGQDPPDEISLDAFKFPTGVQASVPFRVNNPNAFEIYTPRLDMNWLVREGAQYKTFAKLAIQPTGGNDVMSAGSTRNYRATTEFYWKYLNTIAGAILSGSQGDGKLRVQGSARLDIGYGPLIVPINISNQTLNYNTN